MVRQTNFYTLILSLINTEKYIIHNNDEYGITKVDTDMILDCKLHSIFHLKVSFFHQVLPVVYTKKDPMCWGWPGGK